MNKYLWVYSLWMTITTCIYAFLYISSPLGNYGVMWMTFVALPIFFTSGAKLNEVPHYLCSMIAGLLWGLINLAFVGFLSKAGCSPAVANAINLLVLTIPCVGLHLTVLGNTWFNKVPMIFGGLAMTFSQGGKNMIPIGITLALGILLGEIYALGGSWLEKKMIRQAD